MRVMASAVLSYRWASEDDGRRFLGFMVTAIVGGALEWRPHMMLTAPAAYGKSWLLTNVVDPLMGALMERLADATPAAVARLTGNSSLPISVDEAEPSSPFVVALLALLRISAGAEGKRVRADGATGGVVAQDPRFSALLSNTAVPDLSRADATRYTIVRFGKRVENWTAVRRGIKSSMKKADAARYRIIRRAPEIVAHAGKLADEFQELDMDSREALASAALTAGWHAWGLDTKEVFASAKDDEVQLDATDCLRDIMALRVRDPGGTMRSLANVVSGATDSDARTVADLFGVVVKERNLLISPFNSGLKAELSRTKWSNTNLKLALLHLPHTSFTDHPVTFGPRRTRAVKVSHEMLEIAGLNLDSGQGQLAESES